MTALDDSSAVYQTPARNGGFPRPTTETFAEWSDDELKDRVAYYQRERARSIEAANERTPGTVAFCDYKMDLMLDELAQRKALAHRFRDDPRGPRWSTAGGRRRNDLVAFAQELKAIWPIDRFLTELLLVQLHPAGRNRWRCRCITGLHEDHRPSMVVYGEDNHAHCFTCGYHAGDVLDLTMLHFGLESFSGAVRKLADATYPAGEERA